MSKKRFFSIFMCILYLALIPVENLQAAEFTGIKKIKLDIKEDEIAFTFIQLSNGEATLIRNKDETILVNTGSESAKDELINKLKVFDIKSIDKLIITNDDPSYIGNMDTIVKRFDVSKIYTTNKIAHRMCHGEKVSYCFLFNEWNKGVHYLLDNLKAEVVNISDDGGANILFTHGKCSLFYMGYTQSVEEQKEQSIHARILKVSDYGSGKEFDDTYIKEMDPDMAIFFHHNELEASNALISQIESDWVDIYLLNKTGTITVLMNPSNYDVKTYY